MRKKKLRFKVGSIKSFTPEEVRVGFSDQQLEELCQPGVSEFFSKLIPYPASEMNGLGRGLRALARFPRWLPIPASLEHGVDFRTHLEGYQEKEFSRYFLTWSRWRVRAEETTTKKIHLTMFPLVGLRKKLKIQKLASAQGTLIFIDHSLPGWNPPDDVVESIEHFSRLAPEFHPLVLCIHMHDVNKGLHLRLKEFGMPIVTAGSIYNYWFADRFYSILRNFQYATSPRIGTHTLLSEEMGVRFFLGGNPKLIERQVNPPVSSGPLSDDEYRYADMAKAFSVFPPLPSLEKEQLVDYSLGTGIPYSEHSTRLKLFFFRETVLNFPYAVAQLYAKAQSAATKRWGRRPSPL